MNHRTPLARCLAVIRERNAALRWRLDDETVQQYAQNLAAHISDHTTDDMLSDMAVNYRLDHGVVAALRAHAHPEHEAQWAQWMQQVLVVLRSAGLHWADDPAISEDDLAQIARAELVRALPAYRYQSRFSTWAYGVVVQIVKRYLRDRRALKRAARPESLDTVAESALPAGLGQAEAAAQSASLLAAINAVLGEHPDGRLRQIFHLWAVEDRRVAEIGALIHLHPSRVRALLALARTLLSEHPDIRAWRAPEDSQNLPRIETY